MKKVIRVTDLCCERCGDPRAVKLQLMDGVLRASAKAKKNCVFVEITDAVSDETLFQKVTEEGFEVVEIAKRKGLVG